MIFRADLLAFLSSGNDEHHKKGWMDWEELYEMRRYTINFNPAIESEREPKKPHEPQNSWADLQTMLLALQSHVAALEAPDRPAQQQTGGDQ